MSSRSDVLSGLLEHAGIQKFLDDNDYTEVVVNRPNEIWTEGSEGWVKHDAPNLDFSMCQKIATTFAVFNKMEIKKELPICSGVMPNGERGQVVIPSACERGTVSIVIRRPSKTRFSIKGYISSGRLNKWRDVSDFQSKANTTPDSLQAEILENKSEIDRLNKLLGIPEDVRLQLFELQMLKAKAERDIESFIELAVLNRQNFVLVGGTGSGKTTFTKAICDIVPSETRVITIEDTAELDLPNHPNRVHLFYGEDVTSGQLLKSILRMKPDRIFLTELRGDEAWDYLSVLNTGHAGSITTVHANDCASAYYRIGSLIKQSSVGQKLDFNYIMNEVFTTLDVVMYMEHTYVTEIAFDPVRKYRLLKGKTP